VEAVAKYAEAVAKYAEVRAECLLCSNPAANASNDSFLTVTGGVEPVFVEARAPSGAQPANSGRDDVDHASLASVYQANLARNSPALFDS
jgi:hypothetical protein